jgi:preprotein translocase subunit SecE
VAKNVVPAKSEVTLKTRWENVKQYFINVYRELKKVHWPGRTQLIGYTGVVLISVALIALIIWVFDTGLSFGLEKLFKAFA